MEIKNPVLVLFDEWHKLTVEALLPWLTDEEKEQLEIDLNDFAGDIVAAYEDLDDATDSVCYQIYDYPAINKMVDRVKSDPAYQAERASLTGGGVTFK